MRIVLTFLLILFFNISFSKEIEKSYHINKTVKANGISDLINNSKKTTFDFKNKTYSVDEPIQINRSNITIKNLQIVVVSKTKLYNIIIQYGKNNNRYINVKINGDFSCENALSVYNSKRVYVNNCSFRNIGYNELNVASSAIRFIGNCSKSIVTNCIINTVYSNKNSTGISISQTLGSEDLKKEYSKRVVIKNCTISNITSFTKADADGIKVLEALIGGGYNKGYHQFKNIIFENCDKRGLKLQTSFVKCHDITCLNGDFTQGAIDFFGGMNSVNGLNLYNLNLKNHTYGIYLHDYDKTYIKNVTDSSFVYESNNKTLIYSECNNPNAELNIDNVECNGHNLLYRCKSSTFVGTINISNTKVIARYNYPILVNSSILLLSNFRVDTSRFNEWYRTFEVDTDYLKIVKSDNTITIDKALFDKIAQQKETTVNCNSFDNKNQKISVKNAKVKFL